MTDEIDVDCIIGFSLLKKYKMNRQFVSLSDVALGSHMRMLTS